MARFAAKMSKNREIKFISHLDYMRCVQRAIRRAGLPISYSKGFNPHANLSFATPLAVGTASESEYMDFELDNEVDTDIIMEKLNNSLPAGIRVLDVKPVDDKFPSFMSIVEGAQYQITIVNICKDGDLKQEIDKFLNLSSIDVIKEGKNGSRVVDIKPMIYSMHMKISEEDYVVIDSVVAAGSRSNLNPELLFSAMKKNIAQFENSEISDITKKETFIRKDGKLKTLMEIL